MRFVIPSWIKSINWGFPLWFFVGSMLFVLWVHFMFFMHYTRHASLGAIQLCSEQRELGHKTTYMDSEIIRNKIFPRNDAYYIFSLWKWTGNQFSDNDPLFNVCVDAYNRHYMQDHMDYEQALSTFEERFQEWEINMKMAKLSLK